MCPYGVTPGIRKPSARHSTPRNELCIHVGMCECRQARSLLYSTQLSDRPTPPNTTTQYKRRGSTALPTRTRSTAGGATKTGHNTLRRWPAGHSSPQPSKRAASKTAAIALDNWNDIMVHNNKYPSGAHKRAAKHHNGEASSTYERSPRRATQLCRCALVTAAECHSQPLYCSHITSPKISSAPDCTQADFRSTHDARKTAHARSKFKLL